MSQALEAVQSGPCRLLLVEGDGGQGKTALVSAFRNEVQKRPARFMYGVSCPKTNAPFAMFTRALEGFLGGILASSRDELESWKKSLGETLGAHAPRVAAAAPRLGALLKMEPSQGSEPADLEEGLCAAICTIADRAHPLVLVLDELQHAERETLALIEGLLDRAEGLLIVGTYRKPHAGIVELLGRSQPEVIQLQGIGREGMCALLGQALGRKAEELETLAELFIQKTGGNPFFVKQLLAHLHEQGLFEHVIGEGWRWDDAQIRGAQVPKDVAQFMATKLHGLSEDRLRTAAQAAVIGARFKLDELARASGKTRRAALEDVLALESEGPGHGRAERLPLCA